MPTAIPVDYPACAQDRKNFAALSERLGQLEAAHPILFHCLATGYGPVEARCQAVGLADRGAPLRDVCAAAGVPYLLRKIPAGGFERPLMQAAISDDGARIAAGRILRMTDATEQARAVGALFFGTAVCDEAFGVWLTKPSVAAFLPSDLALIRSLVFYAWQSRFHIRLPAKLGHLRWSDNRDWIQTLLTALRWLTCAKFTVYFGATPIEDTWAKPYRDGVYEIVPLRSDTDFFDEAFCMQNCLWTYADRVETGMCRLFSVRRRGERLGTAELIRTRTGGVRLHDFRGPKNARMDLESLHVVHEWVSEQKLSWISSASIACARRPCQLSRVMAAHASACALPDGYWTNAFDLKAMDRELELLRLFDDDRRRDGARERARDHQQPRPDIRAPDGSIILHPIRAIEERLAGGP